VRASLSTAPFGYGDCRIFRIGDLSRARCLIGADKSLDNQKSDRIFNPAPYMPRHHPTPTAAPLITPWGPSDSLRERRLTPGPGRGRGGVAADQRERLLAAMVASVARHGYRATRVTDVVELAGVSSRSFYELFADKRACLAAAVEEIVAAAGAELAAGAAGARGREALLGAALGSFAGLLAAQPAAARAALIEAEVAGAEALAPLGAALGRLEAAARERLAGDPGLAGLPAEVLGAQVGAVLEIARTLLREGREAEMAGLAADLAVVLAGWRPPPLPLRAGGRRPAYAPETIDAHDHGERALRALAALVAEQGYGKTTVEQIVGRAAMSPTTFYANFAGKEDALMAAIDGAGAQVAAAVIPPFRRSSDWPRAVRAAYGTFFNFLASRPALARMLIVSVHEAGPAAVRRRDEALRPLQAILAEGRLRAPGVPAIAGEAISGAVISLAREAIGRSGPIGLPDLAPLCTYLALAPFLGAEAACVAAAGDGRPRRGGEGDPRFRLLLSRVMQVLQAGPVTEAELAARLGSPAAEVVRALEELRAARMLEETLEAGGPDGEARALLRPTLRKIDEERWRQMSPEERTPISARVSGLIAAEIDHAIELGSFDARPDRHLSRIGLVLDERGWHDLMAVHLAAYEASFQVARESEERLGAGGGGWIEARTVQALFEFPKQ
jgi:AcrR family transcriptional regulator